MLRRPDCGRASLGGDPSVVPSGNGRASLEPVTLRRRARQASRRAWGALRGRAPRLSVVVPVYNVERYLGECLDRILEQSYDDLEVVLVDDGSTDRSAEIADRYARRHAHVRVVRTSNQGLGAARNTGVAHARGELLAFADSDDVVLPDAYAAMVSTLDETGSDFVVGAMKRNFPRGTVLPPRQRVLHEERRLGITADDLPEILGDVFAWNKVFRRDFWDRVPMSFPERTLYEDQPALTVAYLSARAFDVIRHPVYLWRIRDDGSSLTQGPGKVADLRDRLATKRDSLDTVRRLGSAEVLRTFYNDPLAMDFPVRFRQIPGCDDEFWRMLHEGVRSLWADGPSFAHTTLPVQHRLVAWLVAQGRRADAEAVLAFAEEHVPHLPVHHGPTRDGANPDGANPDGANPDGSGQWVAKLPFWDDASSGIPHELYVLQEHERPEPGSTVMHTRAPGPRLTKR
jgi:glycosyltransferase involved in cell wall biosynthesis